MENIVNNSQTTTWINVNNLQAVNWNGINNSQASNWYSETGYILLEISGVISGGFLTFPVLLLKFSKALYETPNLCATSSGSTP